MNEGRWVSTRELPGGLRLLPTGRWEPWRAAMGEEGPDLSAHRRPLEAASGRTDTMHQGRGTKLIEVG